MTFRRLLALYRFKRRLSRNLAARKTLRPQRQASARQGWRTRRAYASETL